MADLPKTPGGADADAFRAALAERSASALPPSIPQDDSFLARLKGTVGRVNNSRAVAMAGPLGLANYAGTKAANAIVGDGSAPVSTPFANPSGGDAAPAFAPTVGRKQELAPGLSNGWTNVQAAPELTMPQVGHSVSGGGSGTGAPGAGQPGYFGDMKAGVDLLGKKAELTSRMGVAEADVSEQRSDLEEAHGQHMIDIANQEKAQNEQTASDQKAFLAKTQQLSDELGQMKVDPSHLWHEKGAGDRMMFGIAAALSGLASGISGKPDQFVSQWSAAIDRDIDAQKTAIETKKASLSARNSVFAQMLQQTGDARTAAAATKSLMLQGLGQQVKAQSDRLGVPLIAAKADLLTNAVQSEQNAAQTHMDKSVTEWGQQRAAAAAAQAAANRKYVDDRMDKLAEQAFKRDELTLKSRESQGKKNDDLTKRTAELGNKLADDKLADGRGAVDALSAQVAKTKDGDQIEGRRWQDRALRALPMGERLLSNQANINIQNEKQLDLAYQKMVTGSGGSDEQMKRIYEAAKGAGTAAEFANQVKNLQDYYQHRESAIRAGDPEAAAAYDAAKVDNAIKGPYVRLK